MDGIDTRLVYGFLDAGKTTYISESIRDDFFYKRGSTLIMCFEEGEAEYDEHALAEKKTSVVYYDGEAEEDVAEFCLENIEKFHPDRIYVEMNTMTQDLREKFPKCMRVTVAVTLIDWQTMPVYFVNFKKMINQMVSESQQVIFRGCPSKELLAPYRQSFRLMNQKASYLRQDPMGYHEKAFDMFLPFSLDDHDLTITADNYLPFWLDAYDHPEHYDGKVVHFADPVELRRSEADGRWSLGRVVMVCCMADLQFMSFEVKESDLIKDKGWVTANAYAVVGSDEYGRRKVDLRPTEISFAEPPLNVILDSTR